MFCPECGRPIENEAANFCVWCGKDLSSRIRNSTADAAPETEEKTDESWTPPQYNPQYPPYPQNPSYQQYNPYPQYQQYPHNAGTTRRKSRIGPMIGSLLIALVIILAAFSGMGGDVTPVTKEDDKVITDTTTFGDVTILTSGAFTHDVFTYRTGQHTFTEEKGLEKCIVFKLNDSIASKYGYYQWTFFDKNHSVYRAYLYDWEKDKYTEVDRSTGENTETFTFFEYKGNEVIKKEAALYWAGYNQIGDYTVTVKCYKSESEYDLYKDGGGNIQTYTGSYKCIGKLEKSYTWTYKSDKYSLSTTFDYNEYKKYSDNKTVKRNASLDEYSVFSNYVVINDTVSDISGKLASEYKRVKGQNSDLTGQEYANFVLGYVQMCFYYPPNSGSVSGDKMMYGYDDYFAYPMETIFYGMGDCEDTSILAAALFKASGYKVAMGLLPGHAVVGVSLTSYTAPSGWVTSKI
ncbi:MAG: hypothetical protein KA502_01125, partial [Candidatus Methanomethylophilaceae archaeon]|nr:hypothetical protein [Candidatus Methanomethylophilaceae archaeon]